MFHSPYSVNQAGDQTGAATALVTYGIIPFFGLYCRRLGNFHLFYL